MKKSVFIVHRILYYRYYASLIEEALRRGYEVDLWHDYSRSRSGIKGHLFPEISLVPDFDGPEEVKVSTFFGNDDLKERILNLDDKDIVFSLHPPSLYWKDSGFNLPARWVMLQAILDNFYELTDMRVNPFGKSFFAAYSHKWVSLGKTFLERYAYDRSKCALDDFSVKVVGQPEFDSFRYQNEPDKIRQKYGIPKGKKVLLYLPFPYQNWNPQSSWEKAFSGLFMDTPVSKDGVWQHNKRLCFPDRMKSKILNLQAILSDRIARSYWRKGINEVAVFRALKKFSLKNGLFTVVKPRLKFPVPSYIKDNADLVVWDAEEQNKPGRLKELLSVSKIAVSYYSLSVLSAAFANVFHINITIPEVFFPDEKSKFFFFIPAPSIFDFPGVVASWNPEDIVRKVSSFDLEAFSIDPTQRQKYIKEYIGFDDFNSSERLFDAIETAGF